MRRIFTVYPYSSTALLLTIFSLPLYGQKNLPRGISPDWYQHAVATIENKEYAIRDLDVPNMYGAVNHAQHLGYWFTDKGWGVRNFNEDGSTKDVWQTQFLLTGIGRAGTSLSTHPAKPERIDEHRLKFDCGGYAVLYDNEKQGMEQTFLLKKRPAGSTSLQIALQLSGDLELDMDETNSLRLYTKGHPNDMRLVYDELKVWDAHHRRLSARMTLKGHRLLLTVDDSRAVYPVTVDPFAHAASLTVTVDGILNSGLMDALSHTLFGYSVASADLNGDGLSDIVIGAPAFTAIISIVTGGGGTATLGTLVTGAAFVYYGVSGSGPVTTPSKVLQPSGLSTGALFGFSVAGTGTAYGTTPGIMIGAPGQQNIYTYLGFPFPVAVGSVYIFKGGSKFDNSITTLPVADAVLTLNQNQFSDPTIQPTHNPLFGWSVADAGDVNGDGFDDLVIGSPLYFQTPPVLGSAANGRVDLYYGSAGGPSSTSNTAIFGTQTGGLFGFSVGSAGHVNGDATHSGVIIGEPGNLLTSSIVHGAAYVFFGSAAGISVIKDVQATASNGATLSDPSGATGTLFGFSVSTAGDVDNDGHDDMIIGAPMSPSTGTLGSLAAIGKAYVFYGGSMSGGSLVSARTVATLLSPRAPAKLNNLFGYSVGNAGNVTGDVSGDVIVGEPGSFPLTGSAVSTYLTSLGILSGATSNSGQAYVFAGNSGVGVSASPILTASDATTPNQLGSVVKGIGDVDGDGYPDLLVGEPGGSLDLSFNIAGLASLLSAGSGSLAGTLTTSAGLLTNTSVGNSQLFFGFSGTLPLSLSRFTGQAEGEQTLLNWTTIQEENSSYFGIERSPDGRTFTAIGKVEAYHNSTQPTDYSFTDASPFPGNNYYRLNMVDLDGRSAYSNTVVVNFNGMAGAQVAVYPSPAHGSFQLLFRNMTAGRYGMNLLNSAGQTVLTKQIQVSNGVSYNEMVGLPYGLAAGSYVVRLTDAQQRTIIARIVID